MDGPDGNALSFNYSGAVDQGWDLNKSTIRYLEGDYSEFDYFSFFGPDKTSFKDIEIAGGAIQVSTDQTGFAGFVFATASDSKQYAFNNCTVSVQVSGATGIAAGFIASSNASVTIANSSFTGTLSGHCHTASFIYGHVNQNMEISNSRVANARIYGPEGIMGNSIGGPTP